MVNIPCPPSPTFSPSPEPTPGRPQVSLSPISPSTQTTVRGMFAEHQPPPRPSERISTESTIANPGPSETAIDRSCKPQGGAPIASLRKLGAGDAAAAGPAARAQHLAHRPGALQRVEKTQSADHLPSDQQTDSRHVLSLPAALRLALSLPKLCSGPVPIRRHLAPERGELRAILQSATLRAAPSHAPRAHDSSHHGVRFADAAVRARRALPLLKTGGVEFPGRPTNPSALPLSLVDVSKAEQDAPLGHLVWTPSVSQPPSPSQPRIHRVDAGFASGTSSLDPFAKTGQPGRAVGFG